MSEKEKSIILNLSEIVPRLDREDQKYLVGVAEGMAIVKERQEDGLQMKNA